MGDALVVLAQDLIWADRLVRTAREAALEPVAVRSVDALVERIGQGAALAVIDLTARSYDPLEAITRASAAGARVLGVGQHDDHEGRKAALGAGAERVLAYRKLFEDGPATVAAWAARMPARDTA